VGVVLMDPVYGNDSKLCAGIAKLGVIYVADILPTTVGLAKHHCSLCPKQTPRNCSPATKRWLAQLNCKPDRSVGVTALVCTWAVPYLRGGRFTAERSPGRSSKSRNVCP